MSVRFWTAVLVSAVAISGATSGSVDYCGGPRLGVDFYQEGIDIPPDTCGQKMAPSFTGLFSKYKPDVYFENLPESANYSLIFVRIQPDGKYYLIWMLSNVVPNGNFLTRSKATTLASYSMPVDKDPGTFNYTVLAYKHKPAESVINCRIVVNRASFDLDTWINSIQVEKTPSASFEIVIQYAKRYMRQAGTYRGPVLDDLPRLFTSAAPVDTHLKIVPMAMLSILVRQFVNNIMRF